MVQQSEEEAQLKEWFSVLKKVKAEPFRDILEPVVHIQNDHILWHDDDRIPHSGKFILDYIPNSYYLVPSSFLAFISRFANLQCQDASVLKITFDALIDLLGRNIPITLRLSYTDSFGNTLLLSLNNKDMPATQEAEVEGNA